MIRKSNIFYIVMGYYKDSEIILTKDKLGVTLTEMTDEQAEYIGIPKGET